ncbi:USP30 [Bugula neritina]|uniref:Ubiquitin carboxyl-terminal hydrolase n=1 Tax=Bugula neritina TaxID=10212 RepID=A0A7J7JJE1_BUGNE|nr:USP30 [Bugula neritina]
MDQRQSGSNIGLVGGSMCPPEYWFYGAIAASTAAYIFFGDKLVSGLNLQLLPSGETIPTAAGLMNLGQTCFFNVILQALASCQSFCDWIAKDSGSLCAPPSPSETRFTPQANTGSDVRTLLNQIITDLKDTGGSNVVDARVLSQLLDKIRSEGWVGSHGEQHDAHELFHALMDLLHSSGNLQATPAGLHCIVQETTLQAGHKDHPVTGDSVSVVHKAKSSSSYIPHSSSPTVGYVASSMRCKSCMQKSSTKYTEFTSLSLSFPPASSSSVYKLEELLRYYFLSDTVSDVDCENCSRMTGGLIQSDFLREQSIGKSCACLCLHIQRLGWYGYHEAIKRHDKVIFPSRLDISEFTQLHRMNKLSASRNYMNMSALSNEIRRETVDAPPTSSSQPVWYRLVAVIEHRGSENSGHYICYRKFNNHWVYTSDLDTREVTAEHVHTTVPYMLFYERGSW